jgi:hypothetical protein
MGVGALPGASVSQLQVESSRVRLGRFAQLLDTSRFDNGRTVSFCPLLFSLPYPNVYPLFASGVDIREFGK